MDKKFKDFIWLTFGSLIVALGTSGLIIPNNIGASGVTGIAIVINHFFPLSIGIISLLINIPLFLSGFNILGKTFALKSGYVVVIYSLSVDLLNTMSFPIMKDTLLAAVLGGCLYGMGIYLIFISGGCTGGLDILAKIVCSKNKDLQISKILMILDILVYILVGLVFGVDAILYALVLSFTRSKCMDAIQDGFLSSRQCIIICDSNKADELTKILQENLVRGVTTLDATGAYSNSNKKFIYVIIAKTQIKDLKSIVNSVDSTAFVTISPVNEILGTYRDNIRL